MEKFMLNWWIILVFIYIVIEKSFLALLTPNILNILSGLKSLPEVYLWTFFYLQPYYIGQYGLLLGQWFYSLTTPFQLVQHLILFMIVLPLVAYCLRALLLVIIVTQILTFALLQWKILIKLSTLFFLFIKPEILFDYLTIGPLVIVNFLIFLWEFYDPYELLANLLRASWANCIAEWYSKWFFEWFLIRAFPVLDPYIAPWLTFDSTGEILWGSEIVYEITQIPVTFFIMWFLTFYISTMGLIVAFFGFIGPLYLIGLFFEIIKWTCFPYHSNPLDTRSYANLVLDVMTQMLNAFFLDLTQLCGGNFRIFKKWWALLQNHYKASSDPLYYYYSCSEALLFYFRWISWFICLSHGPIWIFAIFLYFQVINFFTLIFCFFFTDDISCMYVSQLWFLINKKGYETALLYSPKFVS